MEEFLKFLKEKLGEHEPEEVIKKYLNYIIQVEELILDDLLKIEEFSKEHQLVLEKYTSLYHLSLDNIGLKSLKNFPKLKELQIVRKSLLIIIVTIK